MFKVMNLYEFGKMLISSNCIKAYDYSPNSFIKIAVTDLEQSTYLRYSFNKHTKGIIEIFRSSEKRLIVQDLTIDVSESCLFLFYIG